MQRSGSKPVWEPIPAGYAVALTGVSMAAAGRMLLNQVTEPHIPLVAFHLVVLAAAFCGGFGPALVSLVSGYLVAGLAFDAPRNAFGIFGMPDLWATAAYVVVGIAVAGSGTVVRTTRRQMLEKEQEATASRVELLSHLQEMEAQVATLKQGSLARSPGAPTALASRTPARTVRVVEDDHDSADSLALLLKLHGYDTEVSYDGISALAADAPDVLIVDIDLPDINGYEIARRVRIDPRFAGTFLIALSGFGSDEDHGGARNAGFDQRLTKPIDFEVLRKVIGASGRG